MNTMEKNNPRQADTPMVPKVPPPAGQGPLGNQTAADLPGGTPGELYGDLQSNDITEQQRMQEALRESEERFRKVFEEGPQGMAFIDAEYRFITVNTSFCQMMGYTAKEMVGLTFTDITHPDDLEMNADNLRRLHGGGISVSRGEKRYVKKNGEILWAAQSISLIEKQDEKVLFLVMIEDITRRKHMEKMQDVIYEIARAADQSASLDTLYPSIHASIQQVMAADNFYIAIYDEKNDLLSFPYFAGEEDFPIPPQKPGKGLTEYVIRNGKSLLCDEGQLEQLLQDGEVELVGLDSPIWLGVPLIVEGRTIGAMAVQDYRNAQAYGEREQHILEFVSSQVAMAIFRKRFEENLHESRHMLQMVLDTIPVRVFWKDRDSNFLGCNKAFALDSGLNSPEELIGKDDYAMGWKDQADLYRADDRLVMETGQPKLNYEEPQTTPEGGQIWLRTSKIPLENTDGQITGILGTYEDITARKKAENALTASEAELRALFASMHDLVLVIDRDGVYRKIAPTNPDLLVRPPGELLGKSLMDFFPAEQARFFLDSIRKVLTTGQTAEFEYALTINDSKIWFFAIVTPMTADETVWVARDITERKQVEETLAKQAEELRQRNEELARLYRASGSLLSSAPLSIQELAQRIVEIVQKEFGQANCSLLMVEPGSKELHRMATVGPYAEQVKNKILPVDSQGLVSQAIRTGKTVNVGDVETVEGYAPIWHAARSEMSVPLKIGNQVIGVIDTQSAQPGAFNLNDERLMSVFAERAALALEHSRLYEQTETRVQQLAALRTIDMAISSSFDINLTLNILLDHLNMQLGTHAADILIYNQVTQTFRFFCGIGFHTNTLQQLHLRIGEGFAGKVALERTMLQVPDLRGEPSGFGRSTFILEEKFVAYIGVPLVAKGQIKGVMEVFKREPLELNADQQTFLEMLASQAGIAIDNAELFENQQRSIAELNNAYNSTLEGWASALELRDKETEGHTRRVTEQTVRLARAMGVNENNLVHIYRGALLHDIGKIGVPDGIVLKPGPLTEDEWEIMRKHPVYAYNLLSPITYLREALNIPYCHHERWNGTGYPRGLKGSEIPLAARIFSVVDVWDALTADRPYRKAWPEEKARKYLREQAGLLFQPEVVEAFLDPSFWRG